ncbi:MAG: RNA polymerase sigma factor [Anaerolineaceae bacterium]
MINKMIPSDDSSLQLLRAQDREAFAALVESTSPQLYGLLLRMLNDEQDAEDVLQETFIKAYAALPTFEGRSSIKTWLFRIATNEALMLIRKRKPQMQPIEIDENEELESPKEIVDWCCIPEPELMNAETRQKMDQAIQHLSVGLRTVFLLRDVEGLSGEETAQIMGIRVDNVKTRLLRARLKLREELSVYFGERLDNGNSHT